MRKIAGISVVAAAVLALALAAVVPAGAKEEKQTLDKLSWLVGDWEGKAGPADFDEHWIPAKGGIMLGVGRWVKGGKAISFEFMRIEERKDGVVFVAQPGGKPGTEFRAVECALGQVVFANPDNSFPKYIRYTYMKNGDIWATISNDPAGEEKPMQRFKLRPARRDE